METVRSSVFAAEGAFPNIDHGWLGRALRLRVARQEERLKIEALTVQARTSADRDFENTGCEGIREVDGEIADYHCKIIVIL